MKHRAVTLLGILAIFPVAAQVTAPKQPLAGIPEIFLIGSVHNMHFEERYQYSLIDLQAQVLAAHPDVICGEITPEAFNGPMEGNFPPEAAMLAELAPVWGMRFVASDWRVSFTQQDNATKELAKDKKKSAEIDAEESREAAYMAAYSGASLYDYTNASQEFQAMADRKFEEMVGANSVADMAYGAWHERNRKIVETCLAQAGSSMRIVFVFGNAHLPELRRQLAACGLAAQIPARAFVPAGLGTLQPAVLARWQRNLKNLEGIAAGTVAVTSDMRAKVKDTNRAPVLRREIELYAARQSSP